jgi:hypothetical protein
VAILHYPDDTVLCIKHDPEQALNLKMFLYMFEMMSGLKINFLKSEIITIGGDNTMDEFYSNMFNFQVGKLPIKYLGIPVNFSK